jgi:hypothetical protein
MGFLYYIVTYIAELSCDRQRWFLRRYGPMRSVAEYLARAAAFDELARSTGEPSLQKRYADIAECYRLLAEERQRLIMEGTIESETA